MISICRNAIANQEREKAYIEDTKAIQLTCSLLQTIYSSCMNDHKQNILSGISTENSMYPRIITAMKAILGAGDYVVSQEYAKNKYGSAEKSLESHVIEFAEQFN